MDPMEQLSAGGPVPKDFNAEDAANMEDVRALAINDHLSRTSLC
jgi:hypothetical protein